MAWYGGGGENTQSNKRCTADARRGFRVMGRCFSGILTEVEFLIFHQNKEVEFLGEPHMNEQAAGFAGMAGCGRW